MTKQNGILIPLLAISVVFLLGYQGFGWENIFKNTEPIDTTIPLAVSDPLKAEAWTIFQNYLNFAKNHDLAGIRSLSHQISATCNDPLKEKECFTLMDSVYSFAGNLKLSEFKHIQSDERQIIMYTDGPAVAMLYFTRNENDINDIKVLGMRFCFEDEATVGTCVKTGSIEHDLNGNGWWDSVAVLFY